MRQASSCHGCYRRFWHSRSHHLLPQNLRNPETGSFGEFLVFYFCLLNFYPTFAVQISSQYYGKSSGNEERRAPVQPSAGKGIVTMVKPPRNAIRDLKALKGKDATEKMPDVISQIDKLVKRGVIHKNKASNLKRKLTKTVKAVAAA